MTLTYLDTFPLVQERNGETCEFASFTEASSASLASLANTPISLINLNWNRRVFWLGRLVGKYGTVAERRMGHCVRTK